MSGGGDGETNHRAGAGVRTPPPLRLDKRLSTDISKFLDGGAVSLGISAS